MGGAAPAAAAAADGADGADAAGGKKGGKKKLVLLAVPVVLVVVLAGLWFGGILPKMLGMGPKPHDAADAAPPPVVPGFFELPEMLVNLNAPGRRPSYMKLKAKLEIADVRDTEHVQRNLPRILDLFNTYLREVRPEELRGSAGTHRLREELMARASIALAPARVTDILFTEMLVQ